MVLWRTCLSEYLPVPGGASLSVFHFCHSPRLCHSCTDLKNSSTNQFVSSSCIGNGTCYNISKPFYKGFTKIFFCHSDLERTPQEHMATFREHNGSFPLASLRANSRRFWHQVEKLVLNRFFLRGEGFCTTADNRNARKKRHVLMSRPGRVGVSAVAVRLPKLCKGHRCVSRNTPRD